MTRKPGTDLLRLIVGSGRSGTTWMLDVLAEANSLRPVFEPLHPTASAVGRQFGYRYLAGDSEFPTLEDMFASAARGALSTVWTDYRIMPGRLRPDIGRLLSVAQLKSLKRSWTLLAKRYSSYREQKSRRDTIVKCIRANLMLDWIHRNFDARVVLLMRHPGAAVESRLRFASHWDPFPLLQTYLNDSELMRGPLRDQSSWLTTKLSRVEALAAVWCIENIVPAEQAAANGYVIAFYEELLEQPAVEWARVVSGLGLTAVPSESLLEKPSQQSAVALQKGQAQGAYPNKYAQWRDYLGREDLAEIAGVLRIFDVDFYSTADHRPNRAAFAQKYLTKCTSA